MTTTTDRQRLREALVGAFADDTRVVAMWEGGSQSFGADDAMSDLDLVLAVDDDAVEAVAEDAMAVAAGVAPVERRWIVPQPSWHGHWQAFLRFEGFDPLLLLDLVVMKRSADARFTTRERHGEPRVHLDREGFTAAPDFDRAELNTALRAKLDGLEARVDLFHRFVDKELARGRFPDAFSFYHGLVLTPLVTALRIAHCPARHDFGFRYLDRDLSPELAAEVTSLLYVATPQDLSATKARALARFWEALDEARAAMDGGDG